MGSEWKIYKVEDFADVVGGGTPSTKIDKYWNGEIPWITPKDLSDHSSRYISKGERNISRQGLENSSAKIVPVKSILLSSRAPVGYLAIAKNPLCTNQGFRSLIVKDGFSPEFVYYLLKNNVDYLRRNASGTTFQELSGGTLKTLEFQLPNYKTQCEIADILGTLDDKIELNQRMNETLETIARTVFQSWFVDFDPVRAKMAGEPYPLPEEVMALFPDELVESKMGLIPKGWEVGRLEDLAEKVENGGTPKKNEPLYWDNGYIPWLTSGEVRENLISSTDNFITDLGLDNSSAKLWKPGTIIVALYGATAGEVCLSNIALTANQACCGLIPKNNRQYFLYLTASRATRSLARQARGSAQQNLSQKIVKDFSALIPETNLLDYFHKIIRPFFGMMNINIKDNESARETLDVLLYEII